MVEKIEIVGEKEIQVNLKKIGELLVKNLKLGLQESGAVVNKEAKRIVPVDTGSLKKSINNRVEGEKAIIGTDVEYAVFVELGTRLRRGQAYLRPALQHSRLKIQRIFKRLINKSLRGGKV